VFLSLLRRDPDAAESRLREHFKIGDELRRKNLFTNYQSQASEP
jgi:GntR family transcriptional regulator, transcriptional repressor for pyruvate dehydrogenase complex